MERQQKNFSAVSISSPEEIEAALNEKVNYSDVSDDYNPANEDQEKVLSQYGAKELFKSVEENKVDKTDITNEYDTATPSDTKVLSQQGANDLHKAKVGYTDLTSEFNPETPDPKKALSQGGAKALRDNVVQNSFQKTDGTTEYETETPDTGKVLNQKGAKDLWDHTNEKFVHKDDIRDEFRSTHPTEEELPEEELVNKVFSWKGARDFYRWAKQTFMLKEGGLFTGDTSFKFGTKGVDEGKGIRYDSNYVEEDFNIRTEETSTGTERSLNISASSVPIIKVFTDKVKVLMNTLFTNRVTVDSTTQTPYSLGIGPNAGFNKETDGTGIYIGNKLVGKFTEAEGLVLFGARVATVDNPVNNVSVDIQKVGHGFDNTLIAYYEGNWVTADIQQGISADCYAQRIDDDNFRAYFSGLVPVDSAFKDESGNVLTLGEFYYMSQDFAGRVTKHQPREGYEQLAFKTVNINGQVCIDLLTKSEVILSLPLISYS